MLRRQAQSEDMRVGRPFGEEINALHANAALFDGIADSR
jgi:hypothetical protein